MAKNLSNAKVKTVNPLLTIGKANTASFSLQNHGDFIN